MTKLRFDVAEIVGSRGRFCRRVGGVRSGGCAYGAFIHRRLHGECRVQYIPPPECEGDERDADDENWSKEGMLSFWHRFGRRTHGLGECVVVLCRCLWCVFHMKYV